MSTLYYGTWEEILPTLDAESVDLVYIDPPYGKEYISNIPGDTRWKKSDGTSENKFHEHLLNDTQGAIDWVKLGKELYRVAKPNTFLFLHCDIPMIMDIGHAFEKDDQDNELFRYKGRIAWDKLVGFGGDTKGGMTRDWEPIIYYCKGMAQFRPIEVFRGKSKVKTSKDGMKRVITSEEELQSNNRLMESRDWVFSNVAVRKDEKVGFPTQKPLDLAEQVVKLTTDLGDTVLDCFAGSGTAPLAAKRLGRQYIAVEAHDKWLPVIEKRLETQAIRLSQD